MCLQAGSLWRWELPPLARGRARVRALGASALGITPARAGKSQPQQPRARGFRNYPRSRGEELAEGFLNELSSELPPLARGRVGACATIGVRTGITPARAGKSVGNRSTLRTQRNYPRSRGEEIAFSPLRTLRPELPPLARGRDGRPGDYPPLRGITPARAGKRKPARAVTSAARNYPRSRGEERVASTRPDSSRELPPLARGRG